MLKGFGKFNAGFTINRAHFAVGDFINALPQDARRCKFCAAVLTRTTI